MPKKIEQMARQKKTQNTKKITKATDIELETVASTRERRVQFCSIDVVSGFDTTVCMQNRPFSRFCANPLKNGHKAHDFTNKKTLFPWIYTIDFLRLNFLPFPDNEFMTEN